MRSNMPWFSAPVLSVFYMSLSVIPYMGPKTTMPRTRKFFIDMPFEWFEMAAELPGKASVVATLIWHQAKLGESAGPLTLRSALIDRCGLARETVAKGTLRAGRGRANQG
jgi:hypothetical protein